MALSRPERYKRIHLRGAARLGWPTVDGYAGFAEGLTCC